MTGAPRPGGIPRYRPFAGPTLFRQGFRPFFLGAGLWSLIAGALWAAVFAEGLSLPTAFDPVTWHAHEMLFGFVTAAVAGYLLTAIPNWTGRMPLQGAGLVALFALWALGRAAVALSALIGAPAAMLLDLAFPAFLLAAVLYEIVSGRNWRNLPMAVAFAALGLGNLLTHLDALGLVSSAALGLRLGIVVAVFLIALVGGRIVPSFTRNWLAKRGAARMPAPVGRFDRFCLGLTLIALAGWTAAPESPAAGGVLLAAGAANAARLARWQGARTLAEPMVWSLHLGFLWVPAGLLLAGLGALLPEAAPPSAGLHALTAGAMGAMTLAVMTRATLSYAGRPPKADRWAALLYLAVSAAAALRVLAPFAADAYLPLMEASALAWSLAFGLFVVRFGPLLAGFRDSSRGST